VVESEGEEDMTLRARLQAARDQALAIGLPARRKDADLYRLLAACLAFCEEVERDNLHEELRDAVRVSVDERNPEIWGQGRGAGNQGRGRRYVETGSDCYILVSRFVLEQVDTRNSVYRYAKALRVAGKRQMRAADLVEWLTKNGGVRALESSVPANTGKGRYARLIRAAQAVVETNAPSIKALDAMRDALAQIQEK